jgi:peptidyl-prolyl cis-trans isomerase C
MRPLSSLTLPSTFAALLLATQGADSAIESSKGNTVLVRAGESTIDSGRIAKSFARLREFQRQRFGATPKAQLHGYVEQVAVSELLLAEHGRKSGMLDSERVRAQHQLILGEALVAGLRAKLEREAPVTNEDVNAYYDAHPELFHSPERIRIMRLLVDSEPEAKALIEKVKQLPNMDDWRNLVREKSRDRATSERGGDLGFVAADGTTDMPELEVEKSLFAAAHSVKDGEVVDQPVPEGRRFAVVWRRGSLTPRSLALSDEAPRIRQQLVNDRLDAELQKLVARLRQEHLREHHPVCLNDREFPPRPEPSAPVAAATGVPAPAKP